MSGPFAPTLDNGIRFDQPVAQPPSGIETLGNVLEGLGAFQSRGESEARSIDYETAWNIFREETGSTVDPSNITSRQGSQFRRMFPHLAGRLQEDVEQFGNGAQQVAARDQRDAFAEWTASGEGLLAQNAANLMFDDEESRQAHIIQEYYTSLQRDEEHRLLAQRAERAGHINNLSEEAWDIEQGLIFSEAAALGQMLAQAAPVIMGSSRGLDVNSLPPELQALVPFESINQNNIQTVARVVRQRLMQQSLVGLQSQYGGQVRMADESYINDAFSTFDSIVEVIAAESDPGAVLERMESSNQYRVMQAIGPQGQAWVSLLNILPNSTIVQDLLLQHASSEQIELAQSLIQGANAAAIDLSGESTATAQVAIDISLTALQESADIGISNLSDAQRRHLPTWYMAVAAGADRVGISEVGEEVNAVLTNPEIVAEVLRQPNGQAAIDEIAPLFLSEFSNRIGEIRQSTNDNNLSLTFENGRFTLTAPEQVTARGQTMPVGIPQVLQNQVRDLNENLSVLGEDNLTRILGPDFEEILGSDEVSGPDRVVDPSLALPEPPDPSIRESMLAPQFEVMGGGTVSLEGETIDTFNNNQSNAVFVENMVASLAVTESSNNFFEQNNEEGSGGRGHFGRLQFSRGRYAEAQTALPQLQGVSIEEFANSPALQVIAERWHINDYRRRLRQDGIIDYVGTTVNGYPITESGLIAMAHLGGYDGMRNFMENGDDPSDVYNTHLSDYLVRHADANPVQLAPLQGANQYAEGVYTNASMSPTFTMEGASHMTREGAEQRMADVTIPALGRLQRYFGAHVQINDAIALEGSSRESNTQNSRHFFGDALDIDITGMSSDEQLRLVRAAWMAGFRGFGFGSNILHVDLGASRSWAYGNSSYGGMPVSELQSMVASGQFNDRVPFIDESGNTVELSQEVLDQGREFFTPDYDEGEGDPTNFTVTQQPMVSQVEQSEGLPQNRTVSEAGQQLFENSQGSMTTPRVPSDIQDLIEGLTNRSEDLTDEQAAALVQIIMERRNPEMITQEFMFGARQEPEDTP
jgi:hypothetical protein